MKRWNLIVTGSMLGIVFIGGAIAATAADDLHQPSSVQQSVLSNGEYISMAPQADAGTASESPSNKPATQTQAPPPPTPPAAGEAKAEAKDEAKEEPAPEEGPWKLFKGPCLDEYRIDIRGFADMGFTWNPDNPVNRFNGPVAYNDRSNEFEFNQLYLIMERVTKTDGCGVDIGGRVDLLYGTDRRFPVAYGLDSEWNLGHRFYGLDMPQAYGDLAINDLVLRGGHFLAPCGYESVMAVENFFYSHSYGFLYGQPTTLTGGSAIYKVNDQVSVNVGLDTGWNDFTDPNNKVNYFGGFNWASQDQKTTIAFETFIGNTDPTPGVADCRTHYCFVLTQKIGEKWRYAFENNYGYDNNNPYKLGTHGDWLSLANYLFYDWNECWTFGIRYEWFDDDDGTVVQQVGPPTAGPIPAHYSELAVGLNWKPCQSKNLLVRTEIREDWAADSAPVGARPFDAGAKNTQFLWATDVSVRF